MENLRLGVIATVILFAVIAVLFMIHALFIQVS